MVYDGSGSIRTSSCSFSSEAQIINGIWWEEFLHGLGEKKVISFVLENNRLYCYFCVFAYFKSSIKKSCCLVFHFFLNLESTNSWYFPLLQNIHYINMSNHVLWCEKLSSCAERIIIHSNNKYSILAISVRIIMFRLL